jgi:hypothetical protein
MTMQGRPERDEAAKYYDTYIDRVPGEDVLGVIEAQVGEMELLLSGITEDGSLYRYAEAKWSIRQVLSHVSDTERVFLFRAFWFARGLDTPLPTFDQDTAADAACADESSWASHVEDFRSVRRSTLSFFRNLPADAWTRRGVASGYPVSVRAAAYILAGHLAHHAAILRERYLGVPGLGA